MSRKRPIPDRDRRAGKPTSEHTDFEPDIDLCYTYDELGRLVTVKRGGSVIAEYSYDLRGNRIKQRFPAANIETQYGYNFAGLMTELCNKKNGNVVSQFKYTYDIDGNQKTKLNGELETSYEYDNLGRLTSETEVNGNTYLYDYDAFSNRSSLTVSGIDNYTTAYEYDLNNRLLTETRTDKDCTEVGRYSYDNNGSQIRRTSEVTEGKKPWSKPEQHLFVTEPKKNGKATLDVRTYNGFGQLIEVYRDAQIINFSYRPDGLRHNKTVTYPFKPLLNRKTTHVWDGQNIVLETNQNDEIKAKYLRGLGLIAQVIGEDAFYYLHNAHGDVVQRISENGASAPQYKYDAFGNQRDIVDTDPNPFRYCGEYFDLSSGEYYLRARQYDPETGRFISEDTHWNPDNMIYGDEPRQINKQENQYEYDFSPLEDQNNNDQENRYIPNLNSICESANLYVYCINNPIMYFDVSGNKSMAEIDVFDYMEFEDLSPEETREYIMDLKRQGYALAALGAILAAIPVLGWVPGLVVTLVGIAIAWTADEMDNINQANGNQGIPVLKKIDWLRYISDVGPNPFPKNPIIKPEVSFKPSVPIMPFRPSVPKISFKANIPKITFMPRFRLPLKI